MLRKENKDLNKQKDVPCSWIVRLNRIRYEIFPYEELTQSQSNFHWFLVDLDGSPESEHRDAGGLALQCGDWLGAGRGRATRWRLQPPPCPSLPQGSLPTGQDPQQAPQKQDLVGAGARLRSAAQLPGWPRPVTPVLQGRPALEWTGLGLQVGPHQGALSSHCARLFPGPPRAFRLGLFTAL